MNDVKTIAEIEFLYSAYRIASQRHPIDMFTKNFFNYCKKRSTDGKFTQEIIDSWCRKRETEKNNSQYNRVKIAENVIKFANERGYCRIDINVRVKWQKTSHRLVLLRQNDIKAFFKACDEHVFYECGTFKRRGLCYGLVCKVIFRLLYSNGLRPIEARYLCTEDVDLENGIIYIKSTKGYREHIIALNKEMHDCLIDYNCQISSLIPKRHAFFPNEHGEFLHREWISTIFRMLWSKYNTSNAVPYDFRHNYAIQNINALCGLGINEAYYNLLAISKSMGHSSLNQTIYYYSLTPQYASILNRLSSTNTNIIIHELPNEEDRF